MSKIFALTWRSETYEAPRWVHYWTHPTVETKTEFFAEVRECLQELAQEWLQKPQDSPDREWFDDEFRLRPWLGMEGKGKTRDRLADKLRSRGYRDADIEVVELPEGEPCDLFDYDRAAKGNTHRAKVVEDWEAFLGQELCQQIVERHREHEHNYEQQK